MTTVTKLGTAALLGIACLILGVKPCTAEWFGDIYVGASLTDKHDVTVHDRAAGLATYRHVESDTALAYGLRFGRYLDSVPFLGFGVDYFNFMPNIGPQSVRVDGCPISRDSCGTNKIGFGSYDLTSQALSFDIFLRLPLLKTEAAPWGRVTPYLLGAPPVFITPRSPPNTRLFPNFADAPDAPSANKAAAGLPLS